MRHSSGVRGALLVIAGALLLSIQTAKPQSLVYSQSFDTDDTANWLINYGLGDNIADIFFDYSTVGIPPAPNSTGGSTRGLKLQANVNPATQAGLVAGYGLSVSPMNFSITENFDMRFDMWLNYVPVASGNTATLIGGAGFGTAGLAAQRAMPSPGIIDSIFIGASTDGNTVADYRVYTPNAYIGLQDNSGVYAAGSRDNSASYYVTNFPGGVAPPQAQTNLFTSQTPVRTPAGVVAFKWRDVSLKKVANIITYRIDGVLIATVDASTNGALGGANILFNCYDINGNASVDPLAPTLLFALFDNVRITNFPSVVSVTAMVPDASEAGPTPGTFLITRTEPGPEIVVNYTLSGTAVNGQDYVTLPGSIIMPANVTQVTINVTPINDSVAEFAETVTLSINESPNYVGAGTATITIADNDTPAVDISVVQGSMYERLPQDRVRFRLTRRGELNVGLSVNLNYSGTAATSRHTAPTPIQVDPATITTDFDVNPIDDNLLQGNQTIVCTVASGSGYTVGTTSPSATATIIDDELPAENVLYSDNFNTDSSADWIIKVGSNTPEDTDYAALFAYDYTYFPWGAIPPAPRSTGDTLGLFLQVNKFDGNAAAAALNLYPKNKTFSGNFAVRFDMYLITPSTAVTEYALFGINHSGTRTNWFRNSPGGVPAGWVFDGLFYGVETDAAALGDYVLYSGAATPSTNPPALVTRNASTLTGTFKVPPYSYAGAPANTSMSGTPSWADVEISQVGNLVTLKINNTVILSYTNTTQFTSGNIMLGTCDAYDSIGGPDGGVIYDNLRVVQLAASSRPVITEIRVIGNNVEITFTGEAADAPSAFGLQEASTVNGAYNDVPATITGSSGNFKATRAITSQAGFYRIKRL
jgi:hypothetical protein